MKHYHPRAIGNTHAVALSLLKPSGGRVLDAAAGDRWVSRSLAEMGFDVTSADIEFTDRPLPANCVEANLNERLPFEASSFDGVVSIETIEHLENPWFFLRELSRILRPGGFLILSTPNVSSVFSRVLNAATGKLLWFQPRDLDPLGHITPIHWHLLTEMARRASFKLEQRQYTWARIPILNATLQIRTAFLGECVVARFSKRAD